VNSTPEGYYLVTDTAFPRGSDQVAQRIKAPMKAGTRLPADPVKQMEVLCFDRELLAFRQAAEWGMGALQGSFGRLRVPLQVNDANRRGDLLEMIMRLFNLRTRLVGHNQIRTVYMPIWQADDNEQVWTDFGNMVFSDQRKYDRVGRFHLIVDQD
jgi:hypothetical protein